MVNSMSLNINNEFQVWLVIGLHHICFPTRDAAELAAKDRWPDEPLGVRHARLYYRKAFLST